MNPATISCNPLHLCFRPLRAAGRARCFRCDAAGRVDLDGLDRRERIEYLYARALVGHDFGRACIVELPGSEQ